jgi:signal transduction histidine kinase
MQQGLIPFNPENIQLNMIVEESMEMIQESANLKGIEISTDIPEGIEVFADLKIMQTVIRNLVSNAIKFTPKGGKVSVLAKNNNENKVEISIRDTGIGMNQTMIDNLFRLDIKTNFSGTDGEPSAGLGLLLCKEFIERHDGKISVESDIGKGSTFIFTIPGTEGRLRQTQPFAN